MKTTTFFAALAIAAFSADPAFAACNILNPSTCVGPQCTQGDPGPAGPQGPAGADGAQGPAGPKGDTGATGAQGEQGIQGVAGADGAPGAKGDKGDKGDQGIQGVAGIDVSTGRLDNFQPNTDAPNGSAEKWAGDAKATIDNHGNAIIDLGNTKASKTYVDSENAAQNVRITSNETNIVYLQTWASETVTPTLADHGERIGNLETLTTLHSQQIATLGKKMDRAFEGVAMAMSLQTPHVDIGKRIAWTGGYANFEGYNALSTAATVRFDQTWQLGAGVSYGVDNKQFGVKAAIIGQW